MVRQASCKHCGQDIENCSPYKRGEWRDRGNNSHCPTVAGDAGQIHEPIREEILYRGWTVNEGPSAPVTGRWRALRFGVGMCANTRALLLRMIDSKLDSERNERGR